MWRLEHDELDERRRENYFVYVGDYGLGVMRLDAEGNLVDALRELGRGESVSARTTTLQLRARF